MKKSGYMLLLPLLFSGRLTAAEERKDREVQACLGYSYFSGSLVYEIEGVDKDGPWRSELTFPINNMRLDGLLSLHVDSIQFSLSGWTTLDRDAGTMTDNDWAGNVRDIWSRSDAELNAFGGEGSVTFWALKCSTLSLGPSLGFRVSYFDYTLYDVKQWGQQAVVDGKVLTYERYEAALYPGLAAQWRPMPSLQIGVDCLVTPFTYLWDEDDHVLRNKLSNAEALAWMFAVGLDVKYILWNSPAALIQLGVNGNYSYLTSWYGTQDQEYYAGANDGVSYHGLTYSATAEEFLVGVELSVGF